MKDMYGRIIEEFDVLKVFHFIGARRKKFFMYKIAIVYKGKLYASHINSNPLKPDYALYGTNKHMGTEIVQSNNYEKLDKKIKV